MKLSIQPLTVCEHGTTADHPDSRCLRDEKYGPTNEDSNPKQQCRSIPDSGAASDQPPSDGTDPVSETDQSLAAATVDNRTERESDRESHDRERDRSDADSTDSKRIDDRFNQKQEASESDEQTDDE